MMVVCRSCFTAQLIIYFTQILYIFILLLKLMWFGYFGRLYLHLFFQVSVTFITDIRRQIFDSHDSVSAFIPTVFRFPAITMRFLEQI